MRILALLTDGFGGHGGIAQYNRDLLTALAESPGCERVIALPRLVHHARDPIPERVTQLATGLGGRIRYALALARLLLTREAFDLVLCCHIHLLPLAWVAAKARRVPLVVTVFGIDAWQPTQNAIANRLVSQVDRWITISRYTRSRFLQWSDVDPHRVVLLPNAIRLENYGIAAKDPELLREHDLEGRRVIMTFGRLAAQERYKGFDEMLEVLPELRRVDPAIAYLIVGDGEDRGRLEAKARELGVLEHVRFAGFVDETRKARYYALADAYVMPSRGEGFGFVFLEAMASGLPTVASSKDGSRDPAGDGVLAKLVDPAAKDSLIACALGALSCSKRIPPELRRFSHNHFGLQASLILDQVLRGSAGRHT